MNDQEKRIKLAEFIGWKWHPPNYGMDDMGRWEFKGIFLRDWSTKEEVPFDPKNDATDCNTVIKHLNGLLGWHVQIIHYAPDHAEVSIEQHPDGLPVDWEGDNWMHGVCELALKVIVAQYNLQEKNRESTGLK